MVLVGFTPPDVTNTLPSIIPKLGESWAMHQRSTTERVGSFPILAVPMKCPLAGYRRSTLTFQAPDS